MTTETDTTTTAANDPAIAALLGALETERESLKIKIKDLNRQIRAAKGRKPSVSTGRTRGVLTNALLDSIRGNALTSSEIINTVTSAHNVKTTSVRTLLAALCKKGRVTRTGTRGQYRYTSV